MKITMKEARERLSGLYTPVMTPLKENYEIDFGLLRHNVRHLLDEGFEDGVGSLLVAGAAGEFPTMTLEERKRVGQTVAQEVKGRVPLVFGAQHTDTRAIIDLCKFAKNAGLDFVQISAPYYDPGQTVDDLVRFYKQINEATDIGIMAYTDFWHGHRFPPEFFSRIVDLENIVAVKFSMPTAVEFRHILTRYSDKLAFIDNQIEHVMGNKLGEVGFLSVEAGFHLQHQLQLLAALRKKDYNLATDLLAQLTWPFFDFRNYVFSLRTGITDANVEKAAMELVGLKVGPVRPPARPLTREETAELRDILVKGGAPVNDAPKIARTA